MAAVHRFAIAVALALLMNGQAMAFDIEAHRGGRALSSCGPRYALSDAAD